MVTAVAWVAAVTQVCFLAWELSHAVGTARERERERERERDQSFKYTNIIFVLTTIHSDYLFGGNDPHYLYFLTKKTLLKIARGLMMNKYLSN